MEISDSDEELLTNCSEISILLTSYLSKYPQESKDAEIFPPDDDMDLSEFMGRIFSVLLKTGPSGLNMLKALLDHEVIKDQFIYDFDDIYDFSYTPLHLSIKKERIDFVSK